MRIYLHLTPNREIVPFNYQQSLVGAFHKWLGENELHDDMSLYSLSWLEGGKMRQDKRGLNFQYGATFFISAPSHDLLKDFISGVFQKGTHIRWGMHVQEINMKVTPTFGEKARFVAQSPIFIKRWIAEEQNQKYYLHGDAESNRLMTETLQSKLTRQGLSTDVSVVFDPDYQNPRIKQSIYKGIKIKSTLCPVIVEGDAKAVQFAWEVGIGNSTGIGFGALR